MGRDRILRLSAGLVPVGLLCAAQAARGDTNSWSPYVNVETVNDYSYMTGDHTHDTTCNTEGNGFWSIISSKFTQRQHYTDSAVYDSDFLDPQVSTSAADSSYFDGENTAISFVCAHGTCNDDTGRSCTSGADCSTGDVCVNTPPAKGVSHCATNFQRRLITSSSGSSHGNYVFYGGGAVKWGESAFGGAWAGAGTNGGANGIFMINSCGLHAPFWGQLTPAFAGVHFVAGIMPNTINSLGFADASNWSSRGTYLASYARDHYFNTIAEAWFATMDNAPQAPYAACPNFDGDYSKGGGRGINGCGAHYLMAVDSSVGAAQQTDWYTTWSYLGTNTNTDAQGNAAAWIYWHCNYDCNTYPFTK